MEKELVLVDNTVLSNFALIERDDILNSLFKDLLYTTNEVLQELKLGEDQTTGVVEHWSGGKACWLVDRLASSPVD